MSIAALLLASSLAAAGPWTPGLAWETDFIGFATGPRLEVLRAMGPDAEGENLVGFVGYLPGLEFGYLPLGLGWRDMGPDAKENAFTWGAGAMAQFFTFSDAATVGRSAFYGEVGYRFVISEKWAGGAALSPEVTVFGVPGIGVALRFSAWPRVPIGKIPMPWGRPAEPEEVLTAVTVPR